MRYLKTILSSLGLLLVSSATAMAMMVQDPPIKVDVSTSEGSTTSVYQSAMARDYRPCGAADHCCHHGRSQAEDHHDGDSLRIYSTSLPSLETSRIREAISSGMGGIASRSMRPGPDQTRLT